MLNTDMVTELLREGVWVAVKLCAPLLLLSMAVGVVVAIFQAVTQIHEQTIGVVLKLIVVGAVLLLGGGWMLDTLQDFTRQVFTLIAG